VIIIIILIILIIYALLWKWYNAIAGYQNFGYDFSCFLEERYQGVKFFFKNLFRFIIDVLDLSIGLFLQIFDKFLYLVDTYLSPIIGDAIRFIFFSFVNDCLIILSFFIDFVYTLYILFIDSNDNKTWCIIYFIFVFLL